MSAPNSDGVLTRTIYPFCENVSGRRHCNKVSDRRHLRMSVIGDIKGVVSVQRSAGSLLRYSRKTRSVAFDESVPGRTCNFSKDCAYKIKTVRFNVTSGAKDDAPQPYKLVLDHRNLSRCRCRDRGCADRPCNR